MPTELRWCPCCRDERFFETPPCPDGHGADCPERVCVGCGTAVWIGPLLPVERQVEPVPLAVYTAA
jgi:hypothetical protein